MPRKYKDVTSYRNTVKKKKEPAVTLHISLKGPGGCERAGG